MYVGIRAFEPHGEVRATLAERDRVSGDDNVEIHFDTFDERRRALVFIVNPLGIQADGTKSEGGGFIPGSNVAPGQNDLSADFRWQSRGRVTDMGLRGRAAHPVLEHALSGGDAAAMGRPGRPARAAQRLRADVDAGAARVVVVHRAGGLPHGPRRDAARAGGRAQPRAHQHRVGRGLLHRRAAATGATRRDAQLGGNVRWAMGSNFVVNGTIKPGLLAGGGRRGADRGRSALRALLSGATAVLRRGERPVQRAQHARVHAPHRAARGGGEGHRASSGSPTSPCSRRGRSRDHIADGSRPLVNIARLSARHRRAVARPGCCTAGARAARAATTSRAPTREIVFGRLYFAQLQAVQSVTTADGVTRSAPMWEVLADRTGRSWGFNYRLLGVGDDFQTDNGFVPRTGYVEPQRHEPVHGLSEGRAALFERYNVFIQTRGLWRYDDFFAGRSLLENRFSLNNSVTLRGGWSIGFSPAIGTYAFDPGTTRISGRRRREIRRRSRFDPSERITAAGSGFSVARRSTSASRRPRRARSATTSTSWRRRASGGATTTPRWTCGRASGCA